MVALTWIISPSTVACGRIIILARLYATSQAKRPHCEAKTCVLAMTEIQSLGYLLWNYIMEPAGGERAKEAFSLEHRSSISWGLLDCYQGFIQNISGRSSPIESLEHVWHEGALYISVDTEQHSDSYPPSRGFCQGASVCCSTQTDSIGFVIDVIIIWWLLQRRPT